MLVDLGPVDPRSLIQGDYMRLRYVLPEEVRREIQNGPIDGKVVITLDTNGVAVIQGIFTAAKELGKRKCCCLTGVGALTRPPSAPGPFFFQEGQANLYRGARYGELVVDEKGDSVLVGLRDAKFSRLGPKK